jgi:hypothetical protein
MLLLGLLLLPMVHAFVLDGPNYVVVTDQNFAFDTYVRNTDYNILDAKFFGPLNYTLESKGNRAHLVLYNAPALYNTTYITKLSVKVRNEVQTKTIRIEFREPRPQTTPTPPIVPPVNPDQNQGNPSDQNHSNDWNAFVGFFALPVIDAATADLGIKILLGLVLLVLVVAFGARIYNRVKGRN